jgi:hypothetical protein
MRIILLTLALALTACGPDIYKSAKTGTFSGRIFLMWIDDGGSSGDGKFVFVPVPGDELTFTRTNPDATLPIIIPEMMYTDGGSIPRLAQAFKGFSPWGYAPAYMVHDWVFVAKNCNTDGLAKGRELLVKDMGFDESAAIMAEAIRSLVAQKMVKPNDVSENLIPAIVGGPIAQGLWKQEGTCATRRVTEADRKAAEAAISGGRKALAGVFRTLKDGRTIPVTPARIITTFSY